MNMTFMSAVKMTDYDWYVSSKKALPQEIVYQKINFGNHGLFY